MVSETENPGATTAAPAITTTVAESLDENEREDIPSAATGPEPTPIQQLTTTEHPAESGVVYAVAVDPATLFASTTESSSEESALTTTESLPKVDVFSEGVVYASTEPADDAYDTANGTTETDSITIKPIPNSSAQPSDSTFDTTEDRTESPLDELSVASNSTSVRVLVEVQVTQETDNNTSKTEQLSPGAEAETTISSQLAEDDNSSSSLTNIPSEVISNDPYDPKTTDGDLPTTEQLATNPERTTLPTGGRRGRLLQFEEPVSDTAQPFTPPTTAPGLLPTGNPGSFVSVKVSVSSSEEESPLSGVTESINSATPTEESAPTTHVPVVDALFTMWSHVPEPTTVSPTEAGDDEIVKQQPEATESDAATPTDGPLPSSVETTTAATPSDIDNDDFVTQSYTPTSEVETTAAPVGEADVADHALDRPQEASLIHVLQKSTPAEPKPTLYDSQNLLAFSTVAPRYRDPDSLFKRKTYLRSGSTHQSPVTWMIGICSLLLLWSRL